MAVFDLQEVSWTVAVVTLMILGSGLLQTLVKWVEKHVRINRALAKFPSMERNWWFGSNIEGTEGSLNCAFLESLLQRVRIYPRVYRIWDGPFTSSLVLVHPDVIKPVVRVAAHKTYVYEDLESWLGRSLVSISGKEWTAKRHLLNHAFHSSGVLKTHMGIFNAATNVLLEKLDDFAERGHPVALGRNIKRLNLDIILQAFFSYKSNCQRTEEFEDVFQALEEAGALWSRKACSILYKHLPFIYWLSADGLRMIHLTKMIHSFSDNILARYEHMLEEEKEEEENGTGPSIDRSRFLDILLKAKNEERWLSHEDVRAEVNVVLQGAFSMAATVMWALYLLAKHRDIQRDAQDEIDSLIEDNGSDNLDWSCVKRMTLLTRCVKETLRMYPASAYISRCLEHDIELDDKNVPAGTILNIPLWSLHHNPTVWGEDHMEFKPERFSEESIAERDPFAYQPFTAGPRNCIGQGFSKIKMQLVLARLLHRYNFTLLEGCQIPKPRVTMTLNPAQNVPLKLTLRSLKHQD